MVRLQRRVGGCRRLPGGPGLPQHLRGRSRRHAGLAGGRTPPRRSSHDPGCRLGRGRRPGRHHARRRLRGGSGADRVRGGGRRRLLLRHPAQDPPRLRRQPRRGRRPHGRGPRRRPAPRLLRRSLGFRRRLPGGCPLRRGRTPRGPDRFDGGGAGLLLRRHLRARPDPRRRHRSARRRGDRGHRARPDRARRIGLRRVTTPPRPGPDGPRGVLADPALVGAAVATAFARAVDTWLVQTVGPAVRDALTAGHRVALVAVGGYGRGELSPGSDLDLLLVHEVGAAVGELAEALWYPVWDAGFKLGHAVRTVEEARRLAADDLDTATSLLHTRLLVGEAALAEELAHVARADWVEDRGRRLPELVERTRERHEAAGEVAFLLEPDLKTSRGGLRDIHTLDWIARAHPPGASPHVSRAELTALHGPHDTLLSARVELHRRTGRSADVLLLQEQDEVAAALGYGDADELMTAVATAGRSTAWLVDAVTHRIDLETRRRGRRLRRRREPAPEFVDADLVLVDGTLELAEGVDVTDPTLPLRVARAAARSQAFIDRHLLDRLGAAAPPLPEPWPTLAVDTLVETLATGRPAVAALESLDQVDLLSRLLPEWAPNRSRPQRNAYHRFTVDRHLLETAAEAARLVDRVERPDLLLLGALFHDIGKGHPGDHTEVGQRLVARIGERMGLAPVDVDVLTELVRLHLLLPDVASRRDLDDPATIAFVADETGSPEMLDLLAALTEADSIATGPTAWNAWKAELVGELVARVRRLLQGGSAGERVFPTPEQRRLLEGRTRVVRLDGHLLTVVEADRPGLFSRVAGALALHGVDVWEANLHTEDGWALEVLRVGGGTALLERPDRILADIAAALDGRIALRARLLERVRTYGSRRATSARPVEPQVHVDNEVSAESTVLEVRCPDSIGVLYRITRALAEMDLNIVTAKVQTLGHDVIDAFYVRGTHGGKLVDPHHLAEIERAIIAAIGLDA
ncbi:MAG: [protein-PII] uridylyltransferase [Actinomyces sp.]|nr:MAG: [protein-PII] uridylyltransferase [Actinomyces sp.]